MSTTSLVILAIFTALAAVGALVFMRWQEQKRLEQARLAVLHSDQMGELSMIGESLQAWLSVPMLHFMAQEIQYHGAELTQLKAPSNKRCNKAMEDALTWLNATPRPPARLPGQVKQAQEMRHVIQRLQELIRTSHQKQHLSTEQARQLLQEAKLLNVKVAIAVFDSKATAAASVNNPAQAVHYLKKAETTLQQLSNLPDELKNTLDNIQQRIAQHQEERQPAASGTRLAEGTDLLNAEDDSWKKKHF
ncbi:hypothetical protein [Thalassolituus hydrocarboniclasticus]|uniref:DNA repair protein n=1 Tax=Thalassolituus hydrocarboniclasticus TaxID=2742796 RepID=A0ABY6A9W9_9GAMM|nr:hypothetical protein [Thalassolituus hydrocarboniclasticus]UXD87643.1 hypothetical protein HUF19_09475 [Thalassolituus hydrocarboniclasticus]